MRLLLAAEGQCRDVAAVDCSLMLQLQLCADDCHLRREVTMADHSSLVKTPLSQKAGLRAAFVVYHNCEIVRQSARRSIRVTVFERSTLAAVLHVFRPCDVQVQLSAEAASQAVIRLASALIA